MKFTYSCGQKPLEGYEIKRGVGRGGFGEVYFGLSDGGKEVALKVIQSHLDIELRGIHQCLNLKHANLVHLYDLKTDAHGNHWLVMEYVAGESLSAILARHPAGVAPELACEWFRGLAAAIHYLHDHGVVHRDLKPGNIFLEHGAVKIGDYGLCKLLGGSQRACQTQSVGTVHYMAPEISTGNYNRQIDIYAAGIILYEMLSGHVPFEGETAGEILMKHLTCAPDLSKVPTAFVPILDRALCKNPANRFPTIAEMGKKLEDVTAKKAEPIEVPNRQLTTSTSFGDTVARGSEQTPPPRSWLVELTGSLLLMVLLAGLLSFAWTVLAGRGEWQTFVATFYVAVLGSAGVLVSAKLWGKPVDESWRRRLTLMGLGLGIGLLALWLDGFQFPWPLSGESNPDSLRPLLSAEEPPRHPFYGALYPDNHSLPVMAGYLGFFGLMFLTLRWWKMTEINRPARFRAEAVFAVAFWAYVLLFLLPAAPQRQEGFVGMVLAAIVVQLVSPWRERTEQRSKKLRLKLA